MPLPTDEKRLALAKEVMQAFDDLHGVFPGHRPAHAKGILVTGTFTPTAEAAKLSIAPHFQGPTPVSVRFSNFAGVPMAADNKPDEASPRGCAVRFQLGAHKHTDIVAHSTDSFPVRTAPEFVEFLRALKASGPDVPHPHLIVARYYLAHARVRLRDRRVANRHHARAHRLRILGCLHKQPIAV